jgi:pimeloyl-ACP methyl ester carboxylesterase
MRSWPRLLLLFLLSACHPGGPKGAHQASARHVISDGVVEIGGGLALHIHCVGEGAPTVVMDAGLGNDGSVWKDVQRELGRSTRVCAYDRAGMGYSTGPAPRPHTNRQMARELQALLTSSGHEGPYVLVGHSMGGINVRLFEAEHSELVVGVVLIDATVDPRPFWSLIPDDELRKFREMLPHLGEGTDIDTFAAGAADMRASSKSLGKKPLVVLTRSVEDEQPWASAELLAETLRRWHEQQAQLPSLSSNALQVIVRNSRHYIQRDAPGITVAAIGEVIRAARTQTPLNEAVLSSLNRQRE